MLCTHKNLFVFYGKENNYKIISHQHTMHVCVCVWGEGRGHKNGKRKHGTEKHISNFDKFGWSEPLQY